jgi:nucleoside-diphosphate-sugar epimerase
MNLVITGANGFIGAPLGIAARHSGHHVTPVHRAPLGIASEFIVSDLNGHADFTSVLNGCDAVIHLAARVHVMYDNAVDPLTLYRNTNTEGTLNLARQAAMAGVKRFIYMSSIKVNGESTPSSCPFTPSSPPQPSDPYALSKFEAEEGLMALAADTSMEVVIIRPPIVYGPGVKGNFASLVHWVRKGVPLPLGAVNNRRSLLALENLVDFVLRCADAERTPQAANQLFLLSDGEDLSTTELLRKVARAYHVPARLLPIPGSWIRRVAHLLGRGAAADRLLNSLVVDSSYARDLLGWRPVVTMDQQLEKMARHDQGV